MIWVADQFDHHCIFHNIVGKFRRIFFKNYGLFPFPFLGGGGGGAVSLLLN
jgi:hypothetical protein